MNISVTFRHMDATEALKDYAKEKVERIRKYFPDPIKSHVVLACDRGYNHIADVTITLFNGIVIKGEESTEDMYSSIDLVMAKIERQVRRYKEKLRGHRPAHGELRELLHSVVTIPAESTSDRASSQAAATGGETARDLLERAEAQRPTIIKKSK